MILYCLAILGIITLVMVFLAAVIWYYRFRGRDEFGRRSDGQYKVASLWPLLPKQYVRYKSAMTLVEEHEPKT